MADKVRFELNHAGMRELLRSRAVLDDLTRRGHAIAAAAGPGHEVQPYVGRNRARVTVRTATTEARVNEAHFRTLTSAFDAGRH